MALSEKKILTSERNAVYVKSNQGRRLVGTVEQNKDAFDKFPQLIMNKYNELIDLLTTLGLDSIVTDLESRYTKTETDTKISEETNDLIETITYTKADGKFKIVTKGGTESTIDTDIEKIPASFELIDIGDSTYLRITNQDGSYTQTDVTSLLNVYTFNDSDTVDFTETNKYSITAVIKPNSITLDHLSLPVISTIEGYVSSAAASAASSEASANASETSASNSHEFSEAAKEYASSALASQNLSDSSAKTAIKAAQAANEQAVLANTASVQAQSYARGGTGTRTDEDVDNAKYYMERAKDAAVQASGFDFQGAWDASKSYTETQIVSYDSTLWTAKKNNINSIPYLGSEDWEVFVGMPDVLDLGSFADETLAEHMRNVNAHSTIVLDANNSEITTQETLYEHETASNAHGNINIDGGGI
nr:MAG TPA: hypothetical protein [Caudoviricetes sp.]